MLFSGPKWHPLLLFISLVALAAGQVEEGEDRQGGGGGEVEALASLQVDRHDESEEMVDENNKDNMSDVAYRAAVEVLNTPSSGKQSATAAWMAVLAAAEMGHLEARVTMAWARLGGSTHFKQDIPWAAAVFTEEAEKGDPEAQAGLGFLHAAGIATNSSQAKAMLYYTFGAFGGSPWAQMALGYRHWAGTGGAVESCEKALDYYRRAANTVVTEMDFLSDGRLVQRARLADELDEGGSAGSGGVLGDDLADYYRMMADNGDLQAQFGLGQLHYQGGRGFDVDYALARHYFQMAADAGSAAAMTYLGKMYLVGSEAVPRDNDTAVRYFNKAAELGDAGGLAGLGALHLYGWGGLEINSEKALEYLSKAVEQSNAEGLVHLGNLYYYGPDMTPAHYASALKYFQLASQSGHVMGFYFLAEMHTEGKVVLRSCPTAVELYKNVAERGRWAELLMDAHTDYIKGDTDGALVKYMILAELGYEVAQSNAAFLLDRRESGLFPVTATEESDKRALTYYSRAAAQGYSNARVRLGDMYYYGRGVKDVDYETAAFHYRLASEQLGNAQAMFNMGYMQEVGLGMSKDLHLAKRWFDQALATSEDALIPATLALIKLQVEMAMENWGGEFPVGSPEVMAALDLYGDLYLLSGLVAVLLGALFRRRVRERLRRQQQQQQQQQ